MRGAPASAGALASKGQNPMAELAARPRGRGAPRRPAPPPQRERIAYAIQRRAGVPLV